MFELKRVRYQSFLICIIFVIMSIFIGLTSFSSRVKAQNFMYLYFGSRLGLTASFQGFNVTDRLLQTTNNPYLLDNYQSFNSKAPDFSLSIYSGVSRYQLGGFGFMGALDIAYSRYRNQSSYSELAFGLTKQPALNTGNVHYDRRLESLYISPKVGVFTIAPIRLTSGKTFYIEGYFFAVIGAARHKYKSTYTRPSYSESLIDTEIKWLPTVGAELGINLYFFRGIYFGMSFSEIASINLINKKEVDNQLHLSNLPKVLATSTFMLTIGFTFNYRLDVNRHLARK